MATKKSSKSNNLGTYLLCLLAISIGIYIIVLGILSAETDTVRSVIIATGLGIFAGGVIGCSARK